MTHHDPREEAVFWEALDCPSPEALSELLEQRCGTDANLRARVTELLRHHASTNRILDGASLSLSSTHSSLRLGESAGSTVGNYQLIERIGEGGMGIVYLAEQLKPVRRQVALKIIKLGMDTRTVVARFELERQTLAMMDHPNIARVLDAGATETGRPYFVMNLVQGESMTTYCDTHKLALRQRIELLVQVCNGVQHAHQKGIIHRDLKPSNILVADQDGVCLPKIIDFGIAKAINQPTSEATLFTRFGDMIGTPAYMSPEQTESCEQDVDTRSDIYSLGVLLYELLTGTTPFDLTRKTYREIQDTIKFEQPVRPSIRVQTLGAKDSDIAACRASDTKRMGQFIQGELDWIVMRCLAKDRTQRYETARDLALDLQRFLAGEAVAAAAPSTVYRLSKFVKRHQAAFAVATGLVLILLGSAVTSLIFAVRAFDAAKRARNAEQLAELRFAQVNAARMTAERERDRALIAEERLAELNRQQRNRAAFYKSVAMLNPAVKIQSSVDPLESNQVLPGVPMYGVTKRDSLGSAMVPSQRLTVARGVPDPSVGSPVLKATLGNEQAVLSFGDHQAVGGDGAAGPNSTETEFLQLMLAEQRKEFGDRSAVVADTFSVLGTVYLREGNFEDAILAFRECLDIRATSPVDPVDRAAAAYQLGVACAKTERLPESRDALNLALSWLPKGDANTQALRQAVEHALQELDAGHPH